MLFYRSRPRHAAETTPRSPERHETPLRGLHGSQGTPRQLAVLCVDASGPPAHAGKLGGRPPRATLPPAPLMATLAARYPALPLAPLDTLQAILQNLAAARPLAAATKVRAAAARITVAMMKVARKAMTMNGTSAAYSPVPVLKT